jgi:hypothetical protein
MAVESIWTPVQIRNVAGDHLFVSPGKMPFREMNGVSQFNDATQKVRPGSEALDDPRNLLSTRPRSPKVVSRGRFSGGFRVFNDPDFRDRLRG